ncbi:single-stranded DNA-binding protein [Nocardia transvalensis]|uniref:single-stranded DNA-binding protein n=1 Tax=Nocardia transvalensis TaxID=37333 RepID=UPI00189332B7|nr:single-stranded DNA-binding protein [Nocardia transvalensis]MBF6329788.1 single-stranded DNA-binding protein [Nocardia transvalensis]
MSDKIQVTVAGNLTADPELVATPNGNYVTKFTVASTPRTYNQQSGQWQDGQTSFVNCQVWRDQAENVAESLHKGDRVVVTGAFNQRSWTDQENKRHTVWELQADDVAASMKFAQVKVNRRRANQRAGQQYSNGSQQHTEQAGDGMSEFAPNGDDKPARKVAGRKQQIQATA